MQVLWRWLLEGGVWCLFLLASGPLAIAFGVVHAIAARRWSFWVATALALGCVVMGGTGTVAGLLTSFGSVSCDDIDPTTKATILAGGVSESLHCTWLSLGFMGLALPPLVVGEVRRRRARRSAQASPMSPPA
jgi:hypothetical protein